MNKATRRLIIVLSIIVVLGILFFALGPFYVLNEGEQAVILRFGQIVRSDTEAGLKFKTPFIDNVVVYSKKIQPWDGDPKEMPTVGGEFIILDTTARWRISDPEQFYSRLGNMTAAYRRLDDIIESGVRTVVSQNTLNSIVRDSNQINEVEVKSEELENLSINTEGFDQREFQRQLEQATSTGSQPNIQRGRSELTADALATSRPTVEDLGIELIDLVIRHVRYSDDLIDRVYDRMISERNRVAEFYRSFGEGQRQELLGQLENEKRRIISEGYEEAEIIKGEADAQAARIYSQAYAQDPQFFEFWRAVESYRRTVPGFNKTLSTDMDYFNFLYSSEGNR
ncbi:protease modulator HflC [Salinispira pacifica]|uniref:Protein HflC n=1 Tax=Salinispira pacifica TaxID=1307761 RepID=V5WH85_9SPIO|nr:protease modulator HflC [Salinispira pacifica]AHC14985.1 HflC protein [Salinispira pacifica]